MSTDLRNRFTTYLKLQRFSKSTQKNYLLAVKGLSRHYNQSPDKLSQEQIQNYILYLIEERKMAWGSVNNIFSGILCFCRNILLWDETTFKMPPRPKIKKLPCILSEEEVKRLFDVTTNMKHRVLLKTTSSAGRCMLLLDGPPGRTCPDADKRKDRTHSDGARPVCSQRPLSSSYRLSL